MIVSHVTTHVQKFISFCAKNADAPYKIKHLVWESAMNSAILYSCESWLTGNLKCIEQPYLQTIKTLLGVRPQTCSELVYAETGEIPVKAKIMARQLSFLKKIQARDDYEGSTLQKAISLAKRHKSPMGNYLVSLESNGQHPDVLGRQDVLASIRSSTSTRRSVYLTINPDLTVHKAYKQSLLEHERIAFTRLRLGSHLLRIETGR